MYTILIADDEQSMCKVLKLVLEKDGYAVVTATDGTTALEIVKRREIDLIISDLKMPGISGLALLSSIKQLGKQIPFVVISAYGTIRTAVEATKLGAVDFITKPFNKDLLRHRVKSLLPPESQGADWRRQSGRAGGQLVYESECMRQVMETVDRIASVQRPVLLLGESGTGKEMIAREIHARHALQSDRPFVSINCPAIPESLFESELFGYRRGAFTDAATDCRGKICIADNGTLFLDEIAEIPLTAQSKLLRFLEERSFFPLGGTQLVKVNTRIVAATNRDIRGMVAAGSFREDLYYRISALVVSVPPLRERREDVEPLVRFFSEQLSRELSISPKKFGSEVMKALAAYLWPGNVRELKNIVERISLMSTNPQVTLADLPAEILQSEEQRDAVSCRDKLASVEKRMLVQALEGTGWNLTKSAQQLGISRSAIRWRIRKHNIGRAL